MSSVPAPPIASRPLPGPFSERRAPYSPEAEMSVLGGMFMDPDAVVKAIEIIDDTMFFREAHRRLYRAMIRLWEQGQAIDHITVTEQLRNTGDYEAIGGAP